MRATSTGNLFLGLGIFVGALAAAGMAVGFEPATMSPEMINLAVYKLTIASALGLVAAGGVILRHARSLGGRNVAPDADLASRREDPHVLREPAVDPQQARSRTAVREAAHRPERGH